jgi:RHS repeat-associated protein
MRYDSVTGLYETPNRDLNPATGTWLEADPAGYVDGNSLYGSFDSAPASLSDAAGLSPGAPVIDYSLSYGTVRDAGWDSGVPIYAGAGGTGQYFYYSTQDHYWFQHAPTNPGIDPRDQAYYDANAVSDEEIQALRAAKSTNVNCMQFATAGATVLQIHQIRVGNVPSATPGLKGHLLSAAEAQAATSLGSLLYSPGEADLLRKVLDAQFALVGGRPTLTPDEPTPQGMHKIVGFTYLNPAVGYDYHFIVMTRSGKWVGKAGSSPCASHTSLDWEMGNMFSGNPLPKQVVGQWFIPGDPPIDPVDVALKLQRRYLIEHHHSADEARAITSDSTNVYPNVP